MDNNSNLYSPTQKLIAIAAHISYLIGGIGFIFVPLIIFILEKGKDNFIAENARQALMVQIVFAVSCFIVGLFSLIFIGIVLIPVLFVFGLCWFVCSLIAVWYIANDREYKYPIINNIF